MNLLTLVYLLFTRFLILTFLLTNAFSWGKTNIKERVIEVTTSTQNMSTILEKAEKQITNELIAEILNTQDQEKMQNSIKKKIYPNTKKFILLTKLINTLSQTTEEGDKEYLNQVLIRFSEDSLKKILISENLFYLDQGAERILTLIEFRDEINKKTYKWWDHKEMEDSSWFENMNNFYNELQSLFLFYGFYLPNPLFSQYHKTIPYKFSFRKITPKKGKSIADFYKSQLMLIGKVSLSRFKRSKDYYKIHWDLDVYNTKSLRSLTKFKSYWKTPTPQWDFLKKKTDFLGKKIATQLHSFYQKGILSTNLFIIEIRGKISFKEREHIKNSLIEQIKNIKNLTESRISLTGIQYSANVTGQGKSLLEKIKKLKDLKVNISPFLKDENHLIIRVYK